MPLTSIYEKYESPIFHYNNVSTYTLKQSFDPSRTPESVKISFLSDSERRTIEKRGSNARDNLWKIQITRVISKSQQSCLYGQSSDTVRTHVSAEYIGTSVVCLYKPTRRRDTTCIVCRTSHVDRGNLAGDAYCVNRTEINWSPGSAFTPPLGCSEFARFRSFGAARVRFTRRVSHGYDKHLAIP